MQAIYTAEVTAKGGREGHVRSSDGTLDLALKVPKSMGGPGGEGTNPEQLFAAGYSACYESALGFVARRDKVALKDVSITAHVILNKTGESQFDLTVELHGSFPGMDKAEAQKLMEAAHQVCPYSRATRGNVPVKLVVD
ncbi:MAG TPA: organic hydroperoxide resistance protein [Gammaproteobacteria bacterium]|jgi:Ohr subfamily peroxiredoxin